MSFDTSAAASSKVTVATASDWPVASATSTVLTPVTRDSAFLTIGAQSSQLAFSTSRITVFSAACADSGDSAMRSAVTARVGRGMIFSFLMDLEEQWRELRKAERDDDKHGRGPKSDFGGAAGTRFGAVGALGTGDPRLAVDEGEAVAQEAQREYGEDRLVGFERRQIADPGPTDAEGEEGEGHDAARRRSQGGQDPSERGEPRLAGGRIHLASITHRGGEGTLYCSIHGPEPLFLMTWESIGSVVSTGSSEKTMAENTIP